MCGRADIRIASRLLSLMVKNANSADRSKLSHEEIMKKQVPLVQKKFSLKEYDDAFRYSKYSEKHRRSEESHSRYTEKRKSTSKDTEHKFSHSDNRSQSQVKDSYQESPEEERITQPEIIQPEITQPLDVSIIIDEDEESEIDDGEMIELIINKREIPIKPVQNPESSDESKEQIVKKIAANGYSEDFLNLAADSTSSAELPHEIAYNKRKQKEANKENENNIAVPKAVAKEPSYKTAHYKL